METPVFAPQFGPSAKLLAFLFTPQTVQYLFLAALILFVIASAVLLYHWLRYNVGMFRTIIVVAVYFGGGFLLLAASYSAALLF